MSGLHAAAAITTALAVAIIGSILLWRRSPRERRLLAFLVLGTLPLSALAFHLVRLPLDAWLAPRLAGLPDALAGVRLAYAPLTEEPAKLLLFVLPWLRRRTAGVDLMRTALAVGLGFGIGEAWMLADLLGRDARLAGQSWHMFGGFIGERLLVCFIHAGFTSLALIGLRRGRVAPFLGMLGVAMACHFLANLPIHLAGRNPGGSGPAAWTVILAIWVQLTAVASILWLAHLGGIRLLALIRPGPAQCPGCGAIYQPSPLLGINLLDRRYERCPACRKWHLVSARDRIPPRSG